MMIPDQLKNENDIYEKLKKDVQMLHPSLGIYTSVDMLREGYYKYIENNDTSMLQGVSILPNRHNYLNIPPGIETDDNNLKPISIVIGNWERYYYIPYIVEMYYSQDYPKHLLELIIVDDDSRDKEILLNTIKEQVKLFPDLKIRYIQSHANPTQNAVKRQNIGMRHSLYDIVILSSIDMIPLGRNYLRGICYAHNKYENVFCMGISVYFGCTGVSNVGDIFKLKGCDYGIIGRLDHGHVASFKKELLCKIRGHDEKRIGWGGHESMYHRYMAVGAKCFVNTFIYSAALPNFPIPLPPEIKTDYTGGYWQRGIIINDENWGTSEKMEEINLYQ